MNQEEPGHHSSVVYPPSNSNGIPGIIPPDELPCNSDSFASSKNQTKVPNNSDSNSNQSGHSRGYFKNIDCNLLKVCNF